MRIFLISLFTSIYLHVGNSDPYVQKNLILVYDVINPGVDYLQFVKVVGKIYQELIQPGPNQIFNKLLVLFPFQTSVEIHPFSGTYASSIITQDLLKFESTIEEAKTLANVSRVMVGLWQGVYNAAPNSLIYVFTNAKPEDKSMMHSIACGIENKMVEVGFVIEQNFPERDIPEEYQSISLQSNGLIMNVHTDTQVTNFLPILLTSTKNKVNILATNNNSNKVKMYTFKVDKFIDEITIASFTFGGFGLYITHHFCHDEKPCHEKIIETTTTNELCHPQHVEMKITANKCRPDPQPPKCTKNEVQITRHLCDIKTRITSFKNISSEDLCITVDTNSYLFGFRVFGVSKFDFDFGFSIGIINCTKIMQKRPIMNVLNYVYIRPTHEEYGAEFKSCKIIATDMSFTKEISLQRISSQDEIYYGAFVPTSQPFYLKVTAAIEDVTIERMSSFAISPIYKSFSQNTYENNAPSVYNANSKTNYYGTGERSPSNHDDSTYYEIETGRRVRYNTH